MPCLDNLSRKKGIQIATGNVLVCVLGIQIIIGFIFPAVFRLLLYLISAICTLKIKLIKNEQFLKCVFHRKSKRFYELKYEKF